MSERIRGRAECASDICEGDILSKQGVRDWRFVSRYAGPDEEHARGGVEELKAKLQRRRLFRLVRPTKAAGSDESLFGNHAKITK